MRSFITNLFIFLCVLLVFPHSGIANTYDSIKYNLDLSKIKNLVLTVEMTVKGKFEDKIVLIWPSLYLAEQFKYIKIFPKYKIDFIRENDDVRAIVTVPNHSKDQIKITYEVHQKRGNPSYIGEAVIRDTLVHAQGMKLFIVLPEDLHVNKKIKVAINWLNIHQGWKMISPYGTRSQMRLNTTVYDLWSSFYVAGTVRMYKMGEDARPVWVALYGNFDIKDRKIISDLSQIIHSQRTFFNDFECPYYAISLIEGDNPHVNGGIGYRNGFSAFFS